MTRFIRPLWVAIPCLALVSLACSHDRSADRDRRAEVRTPADPVRSANEALRAWLEEFQGSLATEVRALNLAWWAVATGAPSDEGPDPAALGRDVRALFRDPAHRDRIAAARKAAPPPDPILARQVAVLGPLFEDNAAPAALLDAEDQAREALERRFDAFRPRLGDRALTVGALLCELAAARKVDARRAAYGALMAIGPEVRADLLALVGRRNDLARALGQTDYHALRLARMDLDPAWLVELSAAIERGTGPAMEELTQRLRARLGRRFGREADAPLLPCLLDDPVLKRLPSWTMIDPTPLFAGRPPAEALADDLEALGLPARRVLERSSIGPAGAGDARLIGLAVDRRGDLRLLARLPEGARWAGDLFFELARLALLARIDPELPWALRAPAQPFILDGAARFLADRIWQPAWLVARLGADEGQVTAKAARLKREDRAGLLIRIRYCLMMIHFERELYRDPTQDLDALWVDLRSRYQGIAVSPEQAAAEWPAQAQLVADPVSHPQLLLALVLARQLAHHRTAAGLDSPAALGQFLTDRLIAPGRRLPWRTLLHEALGEDLNPATLLALFTDQPG